MRLKLARGTCDWKERRQCQSHQFEVSKVLFPSKHRGSRLNSARFFLLRPCTSVVSCGWPTTRRPLTTQGPLQGWTIISFNNTISKNHWKLSQYIVIELISVLCKSFWDIEKIIGKAKLIWNYWSKYCYRRINLAILNLLPILQNWFGIIVIIIVILNLYCKYWNQYWYCNTNHELLKSLLSIIGYI